MEHTIAIVADDLTGALDSAVAFSVLGSSVTLIPVDDSDLSDRDRTRDRHRHRHEASYAVAVSTASRASPAADARIRALKATSALSNSDTLYVKVDSTLRGKPAAHLDGALEAWRSKVPRAFAVICPALPVMGRTVQGGEVLDHLVPITHSAAANDPLTSAASATTTDIFPGARYLDPATIAATGGLAAALRQHDLDAQPGVPGNVCVDASTDADLDTIARALAALGTNAVAVGSAGLAAAIARQALRSHNAVSATEKPTAGSIAPLSLAKLVFLTSLHPAARQQLAILRASNSDVSVVVDRSDLTVAPPVDQRSVVVVTTAEREPSTIKVDEALAAGIAHQSALLAAELLRTGNFGSILIIGGDGANALLRELGADSIRITGELLAGVPAGVLRGGEAHGITIATRSGGFGHDHHLNEILSAI
jgi:uncharacterized protein YgbK (DUF1537 family)